MKHVMVDLETLGTTADSAIMSIGAVSFDLNSDHVDDEAFYASISVESNTDLGRRVQEATLIWWLKQRGAAQSVFNEPKRSLESALVELSDWIGPREVMMWSNGADFDLPMLTHAYRQLGLDVPWLFWNSRCVRTYKGLPQAKSVKVTREGVAHNAFADALYQARLVQAIHRELVGKDKKAVTT